MRIGFALGGLVVATLLAAPTVRGQDPDTKTLKRELDLLKRENDLLKRENELLKREIDLLKKGAAQGGTKAADEPIAVTVGDVEFVYKGTTRNGAEMLVTLVITSKSGESAAPQGKMTIVDGDGNRYTGVPQGGFTAPQVLREGVPLKMVWRFGQNALTKQGTAPPSKVTQFASLSVESVQFGKAAVEFRDVPAVLPVPKKK